MINENITPVHVGMIGTNFISDWAVDAMGQTNSCKPVAVLSRRAETGAAFMEKHAIPRANTDLQSFLEDDQMDAVYVASPNALHYPQVMAALNAHKHVLCEKPLALNRAQGNAMLQKAQENGLILLEAIRPLYDPFLETVRAHLPRIGNIRRATFEFCQYSSRYPRFLSGEHVNVFDASLGNAALLDLGVYCLHCCVALFGMPSHIHAGASYLQNGVEVSGTALLDYDLMQAAVSYSKVTSSIFPNIIQGECGTLVFDTPNQPSYVRLHHRSGIVEELPFSPMNNNMTFELDAFARCIHGLTTPMCYQKISLEVLSVLDAIRRETGISFGAAEKPDYSVVVL